MTGTRLREMLRNHPSLSLGVALVVLGGTYGGAATFTAGHVASHSTVDGVAIGGLSAPEATATLQRALAGRAVRPVRLTTSSGRS